MKAIKIALLASATVLLTAFTTLNIWNADPAHSEVGFSITHLGISDVSGTFNDFNASIKSSKSDFSDAFM